MHAVRRWAAGTPGAVNPGIVVDAGLAIAGAGLIAVAAGGLPRLIGSEAIAGPSWLLALLPLLLGGPLVLRRRTPLLMWLMIWAAIGLLCLLADNSVRGLAFAFVLLAAAYSLGAHASLRSGIAGLLLTAPVVAVLSYPGEMGLLFVAHSGQAGVAVSFLQLLAFWLAGVVVRTRRQAASLAVRAPRRSARRSRPRRPSGPGSPGNCTTSSLITSA